MRICFLHGSSCCCCCCCIGFYWYELTLSISNIVHYLKTFIFCCSLQQYYLKIVYRIWCYVLFKPIILPRVAYLMCLYNWRHKIYIHNFTQALGIELMVFHKSVKIANHTLCLGKVLKFLLTVSNIIVILQNKFLDCISTGQLYDVSDDMV